ncbi:MAG: BrnT family toxin [Gammaproteobacteria bacterium]|nr:BrnT family toxin [Gammaproteobacteria bacterium]
MGRGEAKDRSNIEKHGVSFEFAKDIFDRAVLTASSSSQGYGEQRYISIGRVGVTVVSVVHTTRSDRTRLISARPAPRKERLMFHEKIQKTTDSH